MAKTRTTAGRRALLLAPLILLLGAAPALAQHSEKTYDVRGFVEKGPQLDAEQLADTLMNFLGEAEWDDPAALTIEKGSLIVNQTAELHAKLKELLKELARGFSGKGKTFAHWKKELAKQRKKAKKKRSKADAKVHAALDGKKSAYEFPDGVPATQVLEARAKRLKVELEYLPEGKEILDGTKPKIVLETMEITLRELLKLVFADKSMEELTWRVADGKLKIGAHFEVHPLVGRIYDVSYIKDRGIGADLLIERIETKLDLQGEEGSVEYLGGLLLVRKSEPAHDLVIEVLEADARKKR